MSPLLFQSNPIGNLPKVEGKSTHLWFHHKGSSVVCWVVDIYKILCQSLTSTCSCGLVWGTDSMGDQPAADSGRFADQR